MLMAVDAARPLSDRRPKRTERESNPQPLTEHSFSRRGAAADLQSVHKCVDFNCIMKITLMQTRRVFVLIIKKVRLIAIVIGDMEVQ